MISDENKIRALNLCKDVDEADTPFIAVALEFNSPLWTSDKKLKNGLTKKGFSNFFLPQTK